MGDRANVYVHDGEDAGVYLYTHWAGSELPEIVRAALDRGTSRWTDDQYLARIIFSEMIQDSLLGETGYGIGARPGDGEDRIVDVDTGKGLVTLVLNGKPTESWPMSLYITEARKWDGDGDD